MSLVWSALPLGLVIGLVMGVLGAGGSILSVPALVYLLGQDPTTATTTSLVIVGLASAAGVVAHGRAGRVRWKDGIVFGVLGVVGSWVGSHLAVGLNPQVLLLGFAVLLLGAAWAMLARASGSVESLTPGEVVEPSEVAAPHEEAAPDDVTPRVVAAAAGVGAIRLLLASAARLALGASGVGLLTGLFGVGGGFVVVPMLVLLLDVPMSIAVGTSLVVITINSATALLGRLAVSPALDWGLVVPFAASAVVGVLVGARLSGRLPARALTRAFAGMLIVLALVVGATSVRALT